MACTHGWMGVTVKAVGHGSSSPLDSLVWVECSLNSRDVHSSGPCGGRTAIAPPPRRYAAVALCGCTQRSAGSGCKEGADRDAVGVQP